MRKANDNLLMCTNATITPTNATKPINYTITRIHKTKMSENESGRCGINSTAAVLYEPISVESLDITGFYVKKEAPLFYQNSDASMVEVGGVEQWYTMYYAVFAYLYLSRVFTVF